MKQRAAHSCTDRPPKDKIYLHMTESPADRIRAAAQGLTKLYKQPVIIFANTGIYHSQLFQLRLALGTLKGDGVCLVLESPGGDIQAAYLIVRELRRRFKQLRVFVPMFAKSAATLICLSAEELVLGELGELGPLDAQISEKQRGDSPQSKSCLEHFQALEQLRKYAFETFDVAVRVALQRGDMRLEDACTVATNFTAQVCGPMYAKIDPDRLGQHARYLEVGLQYGRRVLRRYRKELYEQRVDGGQLNGERILRKLVWEYPQHEFALDLEELQEIGLPARSVSGQEAESIQTIADALFETDEAIIDLVAAHITDAVVTPGATLADKVDEVKKVMEIN